MSDKLVRDPEECPKCGGSEMFYGFGLAFGGYGSYVACIDERCGWWSKDLLGFDGDDKQRPEPPAA